MSLTLTSSSFEPYGLIDRRFTCEGGDISPALSWSGVSDDASSLALIMDDPDAPGGWVHWVIYNLPPATPGLPQGYDLNQLPDGVLEGLNDWQRTGYGGPCPPNGRHRYYFTLYVLDLVLPDLNQPKKSQLVKAMEGHVLAKAELMGTYARHTGG